ncbi:MAG TPA: ATP-binding protein [Acetobacteraceae bacterium]|nr:ATP-binding protein [Acetobacteraceae bacterium]
MDVPTDEADRPRLTPASANLIAAHAIAILKGQRRVWEMMNRGDPQDDVLAALCHLTESLEPGALAAVLVLDRDRHCFDRVIAPSASPAFRKALVEMRTEPSRANICAASICRSEPVVSIDIAGEVQCDLSWRAFCAAQDIRACAASPITAPDEQMLGGFMVGFSNPAELTPRSTGTIAVSVQLAAQVLGRAQMTDNITRRNRALEERVVERTRERDQLWELSEDLLVVADYDGCLLRINEAWSRLLGYDNAVLLTQPYAGLVHPDDLARVQAALEDMRRTARPARFDNRLVAADGSCRWIAWTLSPDPDNRRFHGVGRDMTAEVQATDALRQAEEQLRQAQKMEALGRLTGGVAHDFNNILCAILGNLELIEIRFKDERLRKLIQAATRAAERGARLTEQLLVFSRKHPLTPKVVDLVSAIDGIMDMLRRTLGGTTEVRTKLADGLWHIVIDQTQLELAILNLAINARDAMGLGGVVGIGARNVAAADPDKPAVLAHGDYVAISVSDTGSGMSEDIISKAFEPFFTTKEIGKGTGLGLSQVYGLAKQSGGDVRIRSVPGRGTTVEIFVPRSPGTGTVVSETEAKPTPRAECRATVLVVDDQEDVREVAVAHLEALGYPTVQASDSRVAADLLNAEGATTIDLLLVDFAMPQFSGVKLAQAARARRPDLPIVIVTGYTEASLSDQHIEGAVLLRKPYRMPDLANAIEAAMRARGFVRPPTAPIDQETR